VLQPETAQELIDLDPQILLEQVAKRILSLLDDKDMRNFMRLFLSDAARMPDVAELFVDTQQQMLHFLASYFQHHMEQGRLREHDPQVAARAFIGMLLVYLMAQLVFTPLADTFPNRDAYVKEITGIYLDGLRSTP
jgi:AcrR family transcriptional regulator